MQCSGLNESISCLVWHSSDTPQRPTAENMNCFVTAPDHSLCPCTNTRPSSGEPLFTSTRGTCAAARARHSRVASTRELRIRTLFHFEVRHFRSRLLHRGRATVPTGERENPARMLAATFAPSPQPAFRDASVSVSLVSHAEYCSTSQSQAQSIVAYNQLLLRHSDPLLSPRFKFHFAYRRSEK